MKDIKKKLWFARERKAKAKRALEVTAVGDWKAPNKVETHRGKGKAKDWRRQEG